MPVEVAEAALQLDTLTTLPLSLHSRSEPYSVVIRHGAQLSAPARLLWKELQDEGAPASAP
ncbi:hypothetical protein D3C71_2237330 [compost metagenome]